MNKDIAEAELRTIADLLRQWSERYNTADENGVKMLCIALIDKPYENYFDLFNSTDIAEVHRISYTFREPKEDK